MAMLASGNALRNDDHPMMPNSSSTEFLRIPPFPRAMASDVFVADPQIAEIDFELVEKIKRHRVGGSYWGIQPRLPDRYWLVRGSDDFKRYTSMHGDLPLISWPQTDCDPWHMLRRAEGLICADDDDVAIIADLLEVKTWIVAGERLEFRPSVGMLGLPAQFRSPFNGEPMAVTAAIELCGFWRDLIDSNRGLAGGLGFAFWKQANIAPLLWDGSAEFRFLNAPPESREPVALWRAKTPAPVIASLEQRCVPIVEVEDGFLRSQGLGADCVPPLSITVDRLGAYFDPSRPSELEQLLQEHDFDCEMLERAKVLRQHIVSAGLGKYGVGTVTLDRPGGKRRHVLVPGQVEDDRAVLTGGAGLTSNLELLRRVRTDAPDAFILYKPHPDVLAGHRKGAIIETECLQCADQIVGDLPISSLIEMVDEVHVNTSLTGFEALLRKKPVTTHGVPFYAGWGLTRDLGPVPARRTTRLTLDQLVAGTLLFYPRYLDPVTGLPCPAEVAVDRLVSVSSGNPGLLVQLRRLQGKLSTQLRKLLR